MSKKAVTMGIVCMMAMSVWACGGKNEEPTATDVVSTDANGVTGTEETSGEEEMEGDLGDNPVETEGITAGQGDNQSGTEEISKDQGDNQSGTEENSGDSGYNPFGTEENSEDSGYNPFGTEEISGDSGKKQDEVSVKTLEGEFGGWADGHTVEVIVDGNPASYMVEDEKVKEVLDNLDIGTIFTFEAEAEGVVQKILKVIGE